MGASPAYAFATSGPHLVRRGRFRCSVEASNLNDPPRKVVVVGAGWAGLASAHHLSKQGFDVTIIEAGSSPAEEVGLRGFWSPYHNLFSIVEELGIKPFTNWTRSALYTSEGVVVEIPIFQDQTRLPAPLGALVYPQFPHLSLVERFTSIPLIAAVLDFDGTDIAWRKYDALTARELFKQFCCSERLYREAFQPFVEVGLLAPAEQCSAAAVLSMLYYYVLSHQQNFDVVMCRGTVQEKILDPWLDSLKSKGCNFHGNKKVTEFTVNESSGCITGVLSGHHVYEADAFVLAVGISTLQSIITSSSSLQSRQEFLKALNLAAVDVVRVKIWLDRKHYANQLLPLKDEQIVAKLMSYLARCIKEFQEARVVHQVVSRLSKSATHFFPGSYKYMMKGSTSFPNLFMAGDWIICRHGSSSQEKAFVTGLEAANQVVDYFGVGDFAKIIPVQDDEPQIGTLRELNRRFNELREQIHFPTIFYNSM